MSRIGTKPSRWLCYAIDAYILGVTADGDLVGVHHDLGRDPAYLTLGHGNAQTSPLPS